MNEKEKKELELKLRHLEEEYKFSKSGLRGGLITSSLAIVGVISTFFAAEFKMGLLTGNHIVAIVGIVACAIIIYFSFVYKRLASVKLEISKTKIALEMGSSGKAK